MVVVKRGVSPPIVVLAGKRAEVVAVSVPMFVVYAVVVLKVQFAVRSKNDWTILLPVVVTTSPVTVDSPGVEVARLAPNAKRAPVDPSEVPRAAWAAVASWTIPLTLSEALAAPAATTLFTYATSANTWVEKFAHTGSTS